MNSTLTRLLSLGVCIWTGTAAALTEDDFL